MKHEMIPLNEESRSPNVAPTSSFYDQNSSHVVNKMASEAGDNLTNLEVSPIMRNVVSVPEPFPRTIHSPSQVEWQHVLTAETTTQQQYGGNEGLNRQQPQQESLSAIASRQRMESQKLKQKEQANTKRLITQNVPCTEDFLQ